MILIHKMKLKLLRRHTRNKTIQKQYKKMNTFIKKGRFLKEIQTCNSYCAPVWGRIHWYSYHLMVVLLCCVRLDKSNPNMNWFCAMQQNCSSILCLTQWKNYSLSTNREDEGRKVNWASNVKIKTNFTDIAPATQSCVAQHWMILWLLPWLVFLSFSLSFVFLFFSFLFFFFLPLGVFCARSPPETKTDSAIDSPDAQRQEWFAQYFSFWLTTNLQTQGFSMSTKLEKKKKNWDPKKKTKQNKKREKMLKLFVIYCHWSVWGSVHFRRSQLEV